MQSKTFLRIGAVLMLFHCVAHTFGALGWKKTDDAVKKQVITQMTDHRFPFMGAVRSLADTVDGYGFAATLSLFFVAAVMWICSLHTSGNTRQTKSILVLLVVILTLHGVVEWMYFFPFAASITWLSAISTTVSVSMLKIDKT